METHRGHNWLSSIAFSMPVIAFIITLTIGLAFPPEVEPQEAPEEQTSDGDQPPATPEETEETARRTEEQQSRSE